MLLAQIPPSRGSCPRWYWRDIPAPSHSLALGLELNAFRISCLIAAPNWHYLIADAASYLNFADASIVEQTAQNPYWSAIKARFPWKCFLSHSATTCSRIFPIVSSIQSGQSKVEFLEGIRGFCNNTNRAIFNRVGSTLLFRAMMKNVSNIPGLARCIMVHTLFSIPSGPGTFLALARTRSTTASISSAVNSGGPSSSSQGVAISAGTCGEVTEVLL